MKRWISLLLLIGLLCGLIPAAGAENLGKYDTVLTKDMPGFKEKVDNPDTRTMMAAALLKDFQLLIPDHPELDLALSGEGSCRIGVPGMYHMDAYYPLQSGGWLNLFCQPVDGKVTVYTTAAGPTGNYCSVPMAEVFEGMESLAESPAAGDGEPAWDVPDVYDFLGDQIIDRERGVGDENEFNTCFNFYSYANWSEPYVDDSPFINELQSGRYPFVLADTRVKDFTRANSGIFTYYYFRYTGSKAVTPMRLSEQTAHTLYHLTVTVSNEPTDNRFGITVYLSPELTYAGADEHREGVVPDPGTHPVRTPKPTSKPPRSHCSKCHGSGKITCSRCDGKGGKYIYDNSTRSTGRTWQYCSKCGGDGKVECTTCGGDGWLND